MKLIATKTFSYAGRRIASGDLFNTKTDRDGKLLIGIRNARLVEERPDSKIPAPSPALMDRAFGKVEPLNLKEKINPPVDDEKSEDTVEEDEKETDIETKTDEKVETPKVEEPKAVTTPNRRSYNRKR